MQGTLYDNALTALKELFGVPRPLVNKSGARFLRNGAITIYHTELAAGNAVEIAFNVPPVATAFGVPAAALANTINECKALTGHPVKINKQQDWPRVGLATQQDLDLLIQQLSATLKR